MGCGDPRAFKDEEDEPQVVVLVAGCHGAEAEATNGVMNLIQAMETDKDFAGNDRLELTKLARQYRLIIIPSLNPDGRERSPASMIDIRDEDALRINQGVWKDGSPIGYPACKRFQPLDPDTVSHLGGYPNDAGYNIMHDATPGDIRTAEARSLLKLVADERADLVLHMHSHSTPPTILPANAGMPDLHRRRILDYRARLRKASEQKGLTFDPSMGGDDPAATWLCAVNLATMTSLASGALSPVYEQPNGSNPEHPRDYATMLEESLLVIELFLRQGLRERFSPRKELFSTMMDAGKPMVTYSSEDWF